MFQKLQKRSLEMSLQCKFCGTNEKHQHSLLKLKLRLDELERPHLQANAFHTKVLSVLCPQTSVELQRPHLCLRYPHDRNDYVPQGLNWFESRIIFRSVKVGVGKQIYITKKEIQYQKVVCFYLIPLWFINFCLCLFIRCLRCSLNKNVYS